MRLVFAAPAARDLESITDYIALDNPSAAEEIYRTVLSLAQKLTALPEMGRAGRFPGTRELSLPSLPYLIVYEVSAETVTILAVFHGARDLVRALRIVAQAKQNPTIILFRTASCMEAEVIAHLAQSFSLLLKEESDDNRTSRPRTSRQAAVSG